MVETHNTSVGYVVNFPAPVKGDVLVPPKWEELYGDPGTETGFSFKQHR